jgi:hypothetical protein
MARAYQCDRCEAFYPPILPVFSVRVTVQRSSRILGYASIRVSNEVDLCLKCLAEIGRQCVAALEPSEDG